MTVCNVENAISRPENMSRLWHKATRMTLMMFGVTIRQLESLSLRKTTLTTLADFEEFLSHDAPELSTQEEVHLYFDEVRKRANAVCRSLNDLPVFEDLMQEINELEDEWSTLHKK
jgi:hypothetical protein